MDLIDLDHNATSRPAPEVVETVARVMRDVYGNPGSNHRLGRAARRVLEESRDQIAEILGAEPQEVHFTSGGTESINLALSGLARGHGTLLTGPGEHPATRETARSFAQRGWHLAELSVDDQGRLRRPAETLDQTENVRLVSCLLAHNETGVIQDLQPLIEHCHAAGIPTHVDAVQAIGKMPVSFRGLGATAMSFGAHKFEGPRGIGGLVVRSGVNLSPLQFGGYQEAGLRPGTEPVALIAGMARALAMWDENASRRMAAMQAARDQLEQGLAERCAPIEINGGGARRLSNTSSVTFIGLDGEALLVAFDLLGVAASLGSTCASGSAEPSPILLAMGHSRERALATIRLSLGWQTTSAEISETVERIARAVEQQRMGAAREG